MQQQNTTPVVILSLDQETRIALPTREAAYHLNRKMQTLHIWACKENGPIRPARINGRLAWLVADIKRVLSGEVA
ncbi:DNA-binding protein [Pseudomonas sp. FME51]|uniref:DNA-binding protein n=1 Tax=Pseudomonas sp. FME51 TaxID=2742609 RepID=UPI001868A4CE|nr:DNA-binding protein [Pseudomonas sp. FME51]